MFWQVFISGLVLGSISSFHCVGMCGPLALSLPLAQYTSYKRLLGILLYNLGRVVTYAILGLIFGFLGRQLFLAGFQQVFSISIGILILSVFILSLYRRSFTTFKPVNGLYMKVQTFIAVSLSRPNLPGMFLTGMANGLLPCGMVYLAITGALATANIWYGMEFMAAFGLGTIPALMILSLAGFMISLKTRRFIRKLTPYAFLLMGVLLILRGLNLGIPYLSPYFSAYSAAVPCH